MGKKEYPDNWEEIAERIKEMAGWKCENCGRFDSPADGYGLTTHHIDLDKMNCAWWNLVALCQRCHLSWQNVFIIGQLWLFKPPAWLERRGWYIRGKNALLETRAEIYKITDQGISVT